MSRCRASNSVCGFLRSFAARDSSGRTHALRGFFSSTSGLHSPHRSKDFRCGSLELDH